jgi:hypothetical protein
MPVAKDFIKLATEHLEAAIDEEEELGNHNSSMYHLLFGLNCFLAAANIHLLSIEKELKNGPISTKYTPSTN